MEKQCRANISAVGDISILILVQIALNKLPVGEANRENSQNLK